MVHWSGMTLRVFTDGSCLGNPGRGGYACVVYRDGVEVETHAQGYEKTTNNRMEMLAVITALERYGDEENLEIWTDSKYVRDGITSWMGKWKLNGWKRKDGNRLVTVKNVDLWQQLDALNRPNVTYHWVKGHSNEEGNEAADGRAVVASEQGPFIVDEGYARSES